MLKKIIKESMKNEASINFSVEYIKDLFEKNKNKLLEKIYEQCHYLPKESLIGYLAVYPNGDMIVGVEQGFYPDDELDEDDKILVWFNKNFSDIYDCKKVFRFDSIVDKLEKKGEIRRYMFRGDWCDKWKEQDCIGNKMLTEIIKETKSIFKEDYKINVKKGENLIDKIKPGFCFNFKLVNIKTGESVVFPCVVIKRIEDTSEWVPNFELAFFTRHRGGEIGGWLYMSGVLPWRYFPYKKDDFEKGIPEDGIIDKKFVEYVKESCNKTFEFSKEEIYYIIIKNGKKYFYYPYLNKKLIFKIKE